uniref:Tyrosinase copper-binding domain-containing protein n=1 Tax=Acrobeloides nanus TaxID=290746 RepID=A0A914DB33_9BILA
MQMCKDWSRRYGIYIPTGEECDQIPLTFLTTFLSSVDVMPGYMVEMFRNLLPPPPVAMSKNFPQSPPPDFMANQGPPPNMNGGGSLGIMSAKHYTITKHLIGNYTDNGWKCKTLACLCPHLNGRLISETKTCILPNGKLLKKAIRKEYRTLTDDERHRYHSAFKQLMTNGIFDEISSIHVYVAEGSNVHGRPKFWSWHRKYLKKIELELRKIDPDLFLPYWDTTLDQGIPNPYDSIMWTDDFMGRSDENGTVISGPAAHWITLSKKPLQRRNKSDGIE